jgi:hypothetical protein
MGKSGSRQTKIGAKNLKVEIQILGAQRRSAIFLTGPGAAQGFTGTWHKARGTKQIRF